MNRRELGGYVGLLRPSPDAPRVVIYAQGRTGSTLLEELLASTGHLDRFRELVAPERPPVRWPRAYVEGRSRRHGAGFVWHCKPYHLTVDRDRTGLPRVSPTELLGRLHDDGWQVVHLRRRDLVRHALSGMVAAHRGAHLSREGDDAAEPTITVDREQLTGIVERRREHQDRERRDLTGIDHVDVTYEDDLVDADDHQATVDRIMAALGLPSAPVRTSLRRINARPLSEIVANYDEFAGWVRELGMADSLESS